MGSGGGGYGDGRGVVIERGMGEGVGEVNDLKTEVR